MIEETTAIRRRVKKSTLGNKTVKIVIRGLGDIQITLANVVNSLVVNHELN